MSLFEQKSLLAKLMSTENLTIRQAKVATASFDVKNRVLTVPVLDTTISKDVYDLFMGHESGHALWTPLEGMKKAKDQKVNMSVLNVVEDSRIERKIKTRYPGIRAPFINAYGILYSDNFFETEGEDLNELNFIDRVNLHCKIGAGLAIDFTEDERKLLDEVESTQTFDDVIEVTKKICEKMKDQLKEQMESKTKVKIKVRRAKPDEEVDETLDISDMDVEIEIVEDGEEEQNQENTQETPQQEQLTEAEIEEQIKSFTDEAYKKNEEKLFSSDNTNYIYANVPKFDTKKIMDYKVLISKLNSIGYTVNVTKFNEYRRESTKIVSYLVKEFELRKNADQMKRAKTAKTGELNMNRLYSYTFTEDIFKKMTVMPQGKSHGLVMFLDWSGSMTRHFANTVKQLLNLVLFCKKVNIPFDVYCFIDSTSSEYIHSWPNKSGDLSMSSFGLVNLLSSRMNSKDFTHMGAALMKMSGAEGNSRYWMDIPQFLQMSGTPLNQAIAAAMEIVPEFQKKNKLQIVNTVFLTDGEGCNSYSIIGEDRYQKFSHMVIRDPKTKQEEVFQYRSQYGNQEQTDCMLRLLKGRTGSHVIGFFVGSVKDIDYRIPYFFKEYDKLSSETQYTERVEFREKVKEQFRKNSSLIVESTAYDDYYILRSNSLDTDDDEELSFKENATKRGMVTAFSKFTGSKISSRVVLNRFIGLIS